VAIARVSETMPVTSWRIVTTSAIDSRQGISLEWCS
jgi:hypothetical protein